MLSIELLELKLRTSSLALSRLHITLVSVFPAPYAGKLLKSDYQALSLCFSTVQFIPKMADMFSEFLRVIFSSNAQNIKFKNVMSAVGKIALSK